MDPTTQILVAGSNGQPQASDPRPAARPVAATTLEPNASGTTLDATGQINPATFPTTSTPPPQQVPNSPMAEARPTRPLTFGDDGGLP